MSECSKNSYGVYREIYLYVCKMKEIKFKVLKNYKKIFKIKSYQIPVPRVKNECV